MSCLILISIACVPIRSLFSLHFSIPSSRADNYRPHSFRPQSDSPTPFQKGCRLDVTSTRVQLGSTAAMASAVRPTPSPSDHQVRICSMDGVRSAFEASAHTPITMLQPAIESSLGISRCTQCHIPINIASLKGQLTYSLNHTVTSKDSRKNDDAFVVRQCC